MNYCLAFSLSTMFIVASLFVESVFAMKGSEVFRGQLNGKEALRGHKVNENAASSLSQFDWIRDIQEMAREAEREREMASVERERVLREAEREREMANQIRDQVLREAEIQRGMANKFRDNALREAEMERESARLQRDKELEYAREERERELAYARQERERNEQERQRDLEQAERDRKMFQQMLKSAFNNNSRPLPMNIHTFVSPFGTIAYSSPQPASIISFPGLPIFVQSPQSVILSGNSGNGGSHAMLQQRSKNPPHANAHIHIPPLKEFLHELLLMRLRNERKHTN